MQGQDPKLPACLLRHSAHRPAGHPCRPDCSDTSPLLPPCPPAPQSFRLLALVWGGALAGIAQCLFFSHAPKAVAATLYVALGWAVLPFARQYHDALEGLDVGLIVAGGVIYSLGVSRGGMCVIGDWLTGKLIIHSFCAVVRASQSGPSPSPHDGMHAPAAAAAARTPCAPCLHAAG